MGSSSNALFLKWAYFEEQPGLRNAPDMRNTPNCFAPTSPARRRRETTRSKQNNTRGPAAAPGLNKEQDGQNGLSFQSPFTGLHQHKKQQKKRKDGTGKPEETNAVFRFGLIAGSDSVYPQKGYRPVHMEPDCRGFKSPRPFFLMAGSMATTG